MSAGTAAGAAQAGRDAAELEARRETVADFQRRWHRFVRQWRSAVQDGPEAAAVHVARALADGLAPVTGAGPKAPPLDVQHDAARAVVAASGYLDAEEYVVQHRLKRGVDPVRHFVEQGWRGLRAPSLRFDLWAYWSIHLDPTDDAVNPLLHYLLVGRHEGRAPVPERAATRPPTRLGPDPRRVCLFAAYDRDGIVDDYVVDYLTELSRHADVYYLADGVLEPGELAKIAHVTRGAWSVPHAAYDFGSFSMLARDLVGWDVLDDYDEVILANDSCFLLRQLDEVFAEMDARACDWWSLQATSMEHDESYVVDDAPIPLAEAKRRFIGPRHWTDVQYLHLSSYFLVYRRPVIADPGFRFRLDTVSGQGDKMLVIHKYEVGTSRYLIDAGFDFDTFVPQLHAFHPLYSRHVFDLVERGFPLVKRNYVGENPRHVLGLDRWRDRLATALAPDGPLTPMAHIDANLARVSPVDRLHEAYGVHLDTDGRRRLIPRRSVWGNALRTIDKESPVFGHWWAFAANHVTGRLDPGLRAVFEQVRDDPSIHKVVLTRSRALDDDLAGTRVSVLPLDTVDGQHALVRCGRLLVDAEPNVAINLPLAPVRHDFVHPGIGLPVVPHAAAASPEGEWRKLLAMAVSSRADALVRAAGDPDLGLAKAWPTGLPRHDLLLAATLPADMAAEEERLRDLLGDRRLVVLWAQGANPFAPEDVARLGAWARDHDVVLGVRETRVDRLDGWTRAFAGEGVVTLSPRSTPWSTPVHRLAAVVVTDGSPEAHDALVLGTPLVVHAAPRPDTADAVLPGDGWPPVAAATGADALLGELDRVAAAGFARTPVGDRVDDVPLDGQAAWRFAQRLRGLSLR